MGVSKASMPFPWGLDWSRLGQNRTGTSIGEDSTHQQETKEARGFEDSRIREFEAERESADGGWEEADLVPLSVSCFRRGRFFRDLGSVG